MDSSFQTGITPGACVWFVAGIVPWWISHWRIEAAFLGFPLVRFAGGILLAVGAIGQLDSFG